MDILCFGEPLLEFNQARSDTAYVPGFGGDTSNCAVAAARQGAKVGYFTALGSDAFGDMFLKLWAGEGINTVYIQRHEKAHTGIYFITHTAAGHDFAYFRAGSAASLLRPTDVPEDAIKQSKILHLSGISQAISDTACDAVFHAIDVAKAAGVQISYDPNLRLKLWPLARARAIIHAAMSHCDIALPGLDDARLLTGLKHPQDIADFYLHLGAQIVALTLGAEGTLVATQNTSKLVPGYAVDAVDATAAGDTFDGAFLAEIRRGCDPVTATRYANAAAALSTQGYGAVAPIPMREQVKAFMEEKTAS